jgi:hypothetical protein
MTFSSAGTQDYGNGLSLPTYQGTFADPSSGGSIEITEVAIDPNPENLIIGSLTAVTSTGNIFLKTSTGSYSWAATYLADAEYPLLSTATIQSSGTSLTAVFDQDMVDGTELGSYFLECDNSGSLTLTAPTGTGTSIFTYPIAGGTVEKNDVCRLYFVKATDSIESEATGIKLQSFNNKAVTNNSNYIDTSIAYNYYYDFEETGIPAGVTIEGGSGTTDWDGTPALAGAESAILSAVEPDSFFNYSTTMLGSSGSITYNGMLLNLPLMTWTNLIYFRFNSDSGELVSIAFQPNGSIRLNLAGASAVYSEAGVLVADTPVELKVKYDSTTAGNSKATVYKKVADSWVQVAYQAGGTEVGNITKIRLKDENPMGMTVDELRGGNEDF